MLGKFVVAIFLSSICSSLALNQQFSPVMIFQHKDSTKTIQQIGFSATAQMNQADFEDRFQTLLADGGRKIIVFVASDLGPEKLNAKDDEGIRALQNIATESHILEYIPYVENAVDNKVTQGKSAETVFIATTNEFEPQPRDDAKVIVVKLPEPLPNESDFHCLARYDRIMHAITEEYKDALFILSSEQNSRLQQEEHSRKRRAAANVKNSHSDKNALVYFNAFFERSKSEKTADNAVDLSVTGTTLNEHVIDVQFSGKYQIVLSFQYYPDTESWALHPTGSKIDNQQVNASSIGTFIAAPIEFSFSCAESVFIPLENNKELAGVYFSNFQVQFNFDNQGGDAIVKFGESYDCVGFTNPAIWAGLFITFLLLVIMSTGITYIMDIRTMDRFDDPKAKTITVTASE